MKTGFVGLESSGKTLMLAKKAIELAQRNRAWQKKYGFTRKIYSNLYFSKEFEKEFGDLIVYWKNTKDIVKMTGVDIIWDEISSYFSAEKRDSLPLSVNIWLRQGAKQGVCIYFTAQEFHDIHNQFRRRVKNCYEINKLFGSSRGGDNLPEVKDIYGLCSIRQLEINPYNELQKQYSNFLGIPSFLWIGEKLCKTFDTHQKIEETLQVPLEHTEKICPDCKLVEIYHSGKKTKTLNPETQEWFKYWNKKI